MENGDCYVKCGIKRRGTNARRLEWLAVAEMMSCLISGQRSRPRTGSLTINLFAKGNWHPL